MPLDGLPTHLRVDSVIRQAAREGVTILPVRRGDPTSGTLVLKINLLDGFARVLIETRFNDARAWTPATRTDPLPDREADAYLASQGETDPDAWLIEIEDKQGRLWFPGKIVAL